MSPELVEYSSADIRDHVALQIPAKSGSGKNGGSAEGERKEERGGGENKEKEDKEEEQEEQEPQEEQEEE